MTPRFMPRKKFTWTFDMSTAECHLFAETLREQAERDGLDTALAEAVGHDWEFSGDDDESQSIH